MARTLKTTTQRLKIVQLPHARGLPLPAYQTAGAAGMDLTAAIEAGEVMRLAPGDRRLVPAGLILEIPMGFEAQVRPRSGLAINHGITVLNSPGTIDADYRGEVKVILVNLGQKAYVIERGERIAQLVVAPVTRVTPEAAKNVTATTRGAGGFGSTGTAAAVRAKPSKRAASTAKRAEVNTKRVKTKAVKSRAVPKKKSPGKRASGRAKATARRKSR